MQMQAEEMMPCPCGDTQWTGGGGYMGPGLATTCFRCAACRRVAMAVWGGFHLVVIAAEEHAQLLDDWMNGTVLPFWRAERDKLENPDEAFKEASPIPPRLPAELLAYVPRESGYELVNHAESYKVAIPPDPIRVKHDEFWSGVIEELGLAGQVQEVPNQYWPDKHRLEPWYAYERHGARFEFGPRKRVFSIKVVRDTPMDIRPIANAARKANTSFWSDAGWHGWDITESKTVCVHAWGRENLIEYFLMLLEGVTPASTLAAEA